jgi:hypothetical protein
MNKKILIILMALTGATTCGLATAKPVIQTSEGVKGGISKTVTEGWNLSDVEKKNTATRMMSSLGATAVAPSGKIRRKEWTAVTSQHQMCFYNTYGTNMGGRYAIKMNIAGKEVNVFDSVFVAAGQGFCVTRYLEMWVKSDPGQVQTAAFTHVEMDSQATDNEGHGILDVR